MSAAPDTIDFGEVSRVLARGWGWILAGASVGAILALLVILIVPPRFEGTTTVLLRSGPEDAGSPLGGIARNAQGGGFSLGGLASVLSLASGFETEIEILTSRSVMEAVVDSLGLQAEMVRPRRWATDSVFSSAAWDSQLARGVTYRFERDSEGYLVRGPGASGRAVPGIPYRAGGSTFTLRDGTLPNSFAVRVLDLQEAVRRTEKRLRAKRAGGDVAEIVFRGSEPGLAAAVPNAVITKYLERRRTTDRGVNQRRYDFLEAHTDSLRCELLVAEHALRSEQERSGVFDPELFGKAEIEHGLLIRSELQASEVEARAFREVLNQAASGGLSARDLAAYPTFLVNPAINEILARLTTLEAERTQLLDRRTEQDADVQIIGRQIRQLEDQLITVSTAYLGGLGRREAELRGELGRYSSVLAALPEQAEANYRAQREVRRLSETLVALESELVRARLAALAEGGDVRPIDRAIPPNQAAFPQPFLTVLIGLAGGLFVGLGGAFGSSYLGSRVREPFHAELAAGVPVVSFDAEAPLLLRRTESQLALLLLPVGLGVKGGAVARRIAATAALQGSRVVLADFQDPRPAFEAPRPVDDPGSSEPGGSVVRNQEQAISSALRREERTDGGAYFVYRASANGGSDIGVHAAVLELETRFSLVVVALPGIASSAAAALLGEGRTAVLVARAGRTRRAELRETVATLERIGINTAGVVLRRDGEHVDDGA
jgi:uncharacterized protein involved in exopolysaccharide biosynthesis